MIHSPTAGNVVSATAPGHRTPTAAPTQALDRHGRPLAIGAIVVEFDGEGAAGIVTGLGADRLTFAPLRPGSDGHQRLSVRHGEVELIAGPVPTEDPADVDFAAEWRQPTGGTARRRELAGAACAAATAAMRAKAITDHPNAYGRQLSADRTLQLEQGLDLAMRAARALAEAAGHAPA